MHTKTIAQLAAGLAAKEFSSVEITQHYLNRIKQHNPTLNAFVTVAEESALLAAKMADEAIAAGNNKPLLGVPMAQKDLFCTKGIKTSCGSKMLDNFIAPYDATVVDACQQAGMVMLGKLNMDEFAMGSSNENSYYGAVKNPWHTEHVPGGSSGGSAAAVAARLAPISTGTDTGGSIRQPAAFCGITGLKPTYGRVSRYGMVAFASSLDQAGPMALTAEDAALFMNVIAGLDEKDSTSVDMPVPDYTANLNDSLQGLRIGLPKEYFAEGLDPNIEKAIQAAIKVYEQAGAIIKEVSLPTTSFGIPTYYIVAPAECSSNLSRFDGVRYGYRCADPKNLLDLYERSRNEGFGAEVKRRILIGTHVLSSQFYDAYYLKAQRVRRLIKNEFNAVFSEVDVLLTPVTPTPAFKIASKVDDPVQMYLSDVYTVTVNLAGLPAIALPVGQVQGLPVGMQLIGNDFSEAKLLNVAHQYQQQTEWHQLMPAEFK